MFPVRINKSHPNKLLTTSEFCFVCKTISKAFNLPSSSSYKTVFTTRRYATISGKFHSDKISSGHESDECGTQTVHAPRTTSTTTYAGHLIFVGENKSITSFDLGCLAEKSEYLAMLLLESTQKQT